MPTVAPVLTVSPTSVTATDHPVILQMKVDANPFPENITVLVPHNQAITPVLAANETSNTVTITFFAINESNAGTYTVAATNRVGTSSADFEISVQCKNAQLVTCIKYC